MSRSPVGLLPAAGFGTRLSGLETSKELVDVAAPGGGESRPVIEHALRSMAISGIERAHVVIRAGKWDIPTRLLGGNELGLAVTYSVVEETPSAVHTLASALCSLRDERIALAYPDILVEPRDALATLDRELQRLSADVVLALFTWDKPDKSDMVELARDGRIRNIVIKDPACQLGHTWSLAVWQPSFTSFLLDFVARCDSLRSRRELYVGDVLEAAAGAGLDVRGIVFPEGSTLDIGTPDDLARARLRHSRA